MSYTYSQFIEDNEESYRDMDHDTQEMLKIYDRIIEDEYKRLGIHNVRTT